MPSKSVLCKVSHIVCVPGAEEKLRINVQLAPNVDLAGKSLKASFVVTGEGEAHASGTKHGDSPVSPNDFGTSEPRPRIGSSSSSSVALDIAPHGRNARGECGIVPRIAQDWCCCLKFYRHKGGIIGAFRREKIGQVIVPVPCQGVEVNLGSGETGRATVDIVRIVDGALTHRRDAWIAAAARAIGAQVAADNGSGILFAECIRGGDTFLEFLTNLAADFGEEVLIRAVTPEVIRAAAKNYSALRILTDWLLRGRHLQKAESLPSSPKSPAWRVELSLGIPVLAEHVRQAQPTVGDLLMRRRSLDDLSPAEVAVEKGEWSLVGALVGHGVVPEDPERLLKRLFSFCSDNGCAVAREHVELAGELMKCLAREKRLGRRSSLLNTCLEVDDLTTDVCGGPPRGFARLWAEAMWRAASSPKSRERRLSLFEVAPESSECGICFESLCSAGPAILLDSDGNRVCGHYICMKCAEQQKIAQDYDLSGKPRAGACPFCRAEFVEVCLLPDPTVDPKRFFRSVQVGQDNLGLTQREVLDALQCFLPVSEEELRANIEDKLWEEWDQTHDGRVSEEEFFSDHGLWSWLSLYLIELKVARSSGGRDQGQDEDEPHRTPSSFLTEVREHDFTLAPLKPGQRYIRLPYDVVPGEFMDLELPDPTGTHWKARLKVPPSAHPGQLVKLDACDVIKDLRMHSV